MAPKDPEECRVHPAWEEPDPERALTPLELEPMVGRDDLLEEPEEQPAQTAYIPWADLMRRSWGLDPTKCRCGGRRKPVAYVTEPEKIRAELEKLGLWTEPPQTYKARAPVQAEAFDRRVECDGVDPPAPDCVASEPESQSVPKAS